MRQLAPGVWRLDEFPRPLINVYLTEDVLIDAGRRSIRKLADLNPALILPGHGPAVTDIGAFERFVAALPS